MMRAQESERSLESPPGLVIERYSYSDWPVVRDSWSGLTEASPYTTFFISPLWVEAWVKVFGPLLNPEILLFSRLRQPVAACILVRRKMRRGPFLIRRVFLNTAGEDEGESPVVEFNNLLCLEGEEAAFCSSLAWYVEREPWDELSADGFCRGTPLVALREAFSGADEVCTTRSDYSVDLPRVRDSGKDYESMLSAKTRARLRQNYRDYGEIALHVSPSKNDAIDALGQLAELHTKTWEQRGAPGAFSSPAWRAFQDTLIDLSFSSGCIQMVRADTAKETIGFLYNFVYRGNVYFYQSGFSYSSNKRLRPGFVTLARTVHYCLDKPDLQKFHFMAGGGHYKASMSTDEEPLEWIIFRKRNGKNRVIDLLRRLKKRRSVPLNEASDDATTD